MAIDVTYTAPAGFNLPYPPHYKTNTNISLTCRVEGAYGDIIYQWSSTAMREVPAGSNSQTLTKNMVNSYDDGMYTCTATDAKENTGSAITEMVVRGENLGKFKNGENKILSMYNRSRYIIIMMVIRCYKILYTKNIKYLYSRNIIITIIIII